MELKDKGATIYFAEVSTSVRQLFEASGFHKYVPKNNFYPTVHDAVTIIRNQST